MGWLVDAERLLVQNLEAANRLLGTDHPDTLTFDLMLGIVLGKQHKYAEAAPSHLRVLAARQRWSQAEALLRESLNTCDPETPYAWQMSMRRSELGLVLLEQARYDQAEPVLLAGYQGIVERRAALNDPGLIGSAGGWIVRLYSARGRPDQAAQWSARVQADQASAAVAK